MWIHRLARVSARDAGADVRQSARGQRISVLIQKKSAGVGCPGFQQGWTKLDVAFQKRNQLAWEKGADGMLGLSAVRVERKLPEGLRRTSFQSCLQTQWARHRR